MNRLTRAATHLDLARVATHQTILAFACPVLRRKALASCLAATLELSKGGGAEELRTSASMLQAIARGLERQAEREGS